MDFDFKINCVGDMNNLEKDIKKMMAEGKTTWSNTSNNGKWWYTTGTTGTTNLGTWVACGKTESREDFIPTKVIFNPPATICYFPDGTKTVVKCAEDEEFVEEEGVMACIVKKLFTSRNAFKKLVAGAYRQPLKEEKEKDPWE